MRFFKACAVCAAVLALSVSATYAQSLQTRDRGVNPNQELDTVLYAQESGASPYLWEIALPNGTYYVTLASGDASYGIGPSRIRLSGDDGSSWTTVVDDVETVPMEYYPVIEEPVTVTAGKLSMELGGNNEFASAVNFIIISNTQGTPPSFPIEICFQPSGSANPPTGYPDYEVDIMEVYGDRGNGYSYGWDATTNLSARDRDQEADQRLDTVVYVVDDTRTWEIEVPVGTYYLTLYSGDANASHGPHRVKVEGITWIDDIETISAEFTGVVNRTVNIFDGKLTIEIGGSSGAFPTTAINYLVLNNTRPAVEFPVRINFQPGREFELAPNFGLDIGAIFKDIYGYGWSSSRGNQCTKANINSDHLYDTFVYVTGSENSVEWNYEFDTTSPGDYYFYTSVGDPRYSSPRQYLSIEGTMLVNNVSTNANEFYTLENYGPITVSDRGDDDNSTIDVTMVIGHDTEDSWTCPNYLIITDAPVSAWTFPIEIDFHHGSRSPCAGYDSDIGEYYDLVRRYGWRNTLMKADYNQINTPAAPYQCNKESIVYPPVGSEADWEITNIPAGSYDVTMILGDADYACGPYAMVLQGIDVSFGALSANQFQTVQQTITVGADETITLELGDSTPGVAVPICMITIDEAP